MKQVHAMLRLLVCLLLGIAWATPAPPAPVAESADVAAERAQKRQP